MIKLKLTIVGAVKGWFPFFPQHSSHSSLSRLYCTVPLSSLNIHHILLYLDYTVQSLYLPSIFITFFSIYNYTVQSLYLPFHNLSYSIHIPPQWPHSKSCMLRVQHELLLYHEFSRTVQSGLKFYATNVTWRDQSDPLIPHPYIPLHSLYVLYTLHGCLSFCLFESNKRQIEI